MNLTHSRKIQNQLNETLQLLKSILGEDLLGVYLYGSALIGGLQKHSDIDLFCVTNRPTTLGEKRKLIEDLLRISGLCMKSSKRPLEVTLVENSAINPWRYPPHFDFQYGEWLREPFEKGTIEPWDTYEMEDLALIVTQVLLKRQTLWGPNAKELLAPVPYPDFIKAMIHDLKRLSGDLEKDTRNVLLTYARIWSTLETNTIRSKPAAADWAINRLPELYKPVMQRAQSICIGDEDEFWEDIQDLIKPCVNFMEGQINQRIPLIDFHKEIELADSL